MEPNPAPAVAAPAVILPVAVPPAAPRAVIPKAKNRCAKCMYPIYQDAIWGKDQRRGTRFQCEACNTRYVVGSKAKSAYGDGSILYHTLFRRGIVDRLVLSWQYFPDMKKVYITCVCGPLLPIELLDINADGFVSEGIGGGCTACNYCGLHFWSFLEGWAALARSERARKAARARWDRIKAKKKAASIQS